MPAVAVAPAPRYFRPGMGNLGTPFHQRRVLDFAPRRAPGGICPRTNRRFINAVFWILRTGAPWRDLPPDYGDWKNTHRRFCRWRDRNVWAGLLEAVMDDPDYEWLMLDASYIKAHPHSAGARGGNQAIARTKGGSTASCTWRWTPTECR